MLKKGFWLTLVCVFVWTILTACSGNNEQVATSGAGADNVGEKPPAPQINNDPVELLIYDNQSMDNDFFDNVFVKTVKAKYPNITLKLIQRSDGPTATDLVTSGQIPDIVINSVLNLFEFKDLGLFYDMTPLIKKYQFDLNRIASGPLEQVKSYSDKGEIYGIPFKANYNALFYNKDIFDNFGVPYPKDGMMWDEVVELTKRVTRTSGGVQYLGLDPENINRLSWPLGVGFVDPKTNKPLTEQWKPGYELLQRIISIPGNAPEKPMNNGDKVAFIKNMTTAMMATTNIVGDLKDAKFNWDMATYPQYPDHKGTYGISGSQPLMITSQSKYKDQAFQVITTVLSDEVQTAMNRLGEVTTLSNLNVKKTYAADLPFTKGKNLAAAYALNEGYYKITQYDYIANPAGRSHSFDLYKGKDINTVIRETQEEIIRKIEQDNSK